MAAREDKLIELLSRFEELGIGQQIDYDKFYLYSLITHSTAIEGSTVTEVENQLLFDEGISARGRSMAEQLMNLDLKAAYEQSIAYAKAHTEISTNLLKGLSALVMKNTGQIYNTPLGSFSAATGDLRLLNVTAGVGGRSYMNYAKVPQKLAEFCTMLNAQRQAFSQKDIIERYMVSFDAHYLLVTIHPWADGNGRMARLLMNQLQFESGLLPTKISRDRKAEYIEALVETRETDDLTVFRQFMVDEHIRNIEQMIREYQQSIEQTDVPVNVPVNVPVKITVRQQQILDLMSQDQTITIQELSKSLSVTERTIRRDITNLKEQRRLQRIGSDKNGHWAVQQLSVD